MTGIEQELYLRRQKIYPREVHGLFAYCRVAGAIGLLGIYFVIPWLSWGNRPAVLFDLPERKFFVFNFVFWPQDLYLLCALLVIAGFSLFFFTSLAGRLWCGYSCPQTVWTEVFLWIERKIEGNRMRQMRLDRASISFEKVWKKSFKHSLWIITSILTAITFVGYFTPISELAGNLLDFEAHPWAVFWIVFFTLATYVNAGWLREQVCLYMCPYARFQSAMFDSDTLIISYDDSRGEPRGSRSRKVDRHEAGLGDCINCTMCVQVCPTGIDIRDGLQYECIGCAACIDACDGIMEKMRYPKGLIRYTTENELRGKRSKIIRPRTAIYAAILSLTLVAAGYAITSRAFVDVNIIRDRNILYRETNDNRIENIYTLRILNKEERDRSYRVEVGGLQDFDILVEPKNIFVGAGAVSEFTVVLRAESNVAGSQEITFRVIAQDDPDTNSESIARFISP